MSVATAISALACAVVAVSLVRAALLLRGTEARTAAGTLLFPSSLLLLSFFSLCCGAFDLMREGSVTAMAACCAVGGVLVWVETGSIARSARSDWEESRVRQLDAQVAAQNAHLRALEELKDGAAAERMRYVALFRRLASALLSGDRAQARRLMRPDAVAGGGRRGQCAHPVVDAVLMAKATLCDRERIAWDAHVEIPADLPLDDAELGALFANALDNAINAVRALPDGAPRFVRVRARVAHGILAVVVENPCALGTQAAPFSDAAPDAPASPLAHPPAALPAHGWGTRILDAIARQHGGRIDRAVERGVYRLDALIPVP